MKEDWTAISDIGKTFEGKILTVEDYIAIEDSYIKAIQTIFEFFNLKYLKVCDVRKSFGDDQFLDLISRRKVKYTSDTLEIYNIAESIEKLEYKDLDLFFRLMLREDIGAKIFYPRKLKIFICYDYLMGIHTSRSIEKIIPEIEALGLFVEAF
ncbi:hypothetical protein [Ruminiclostridium sufflavum]|nr:hypothetical protein [Ruminiclostridium sufflavum]